MEAGASICPIIPGREAGSVERGGGGGDGGGRSKQDRKPTIDYRVCYYAGAEVFSGLKIGF